MIGLRPILRGDGAASIIVPAKPPHPAGVSPSASATAF